MTETGTKRRTGLTIAMLVSLLLTFASIWLWEVFSYPTVIFGGLTVLFIKLGGGPDSVRAFFRWLITWPRSMPPNGRAKGIATLAVALSLGITSVLGFMATAVGNSLGLTEQYPWSLNVVSMLFRYSPTTIACVVLLIYGIGKATGPREPMYSSKGHPLDSRFVIYMSIAVITFTLSCLVPLHYTFLTSLPSQEADANQWIIEFVLHFWAFVAFLGWMRWGSGDRRWRPIIYLVTLLPVVNSILGVTLIFTFGDISPTWQT